MGKIYSSALSVIRHLDLGDEKTTLVINLLERTRPFLQVTVCPPMRDLNWIQQFPQI
jgi:hypothetical protein